MNRDTARRFALAPLLALGLLLTACNPSSHAVEKSATASTLRRVGYPSTQAASIGCTDSGKVTSAGTTAYMSRCSITTPGVSMQPSAVSVIYSGSTAQAVVLVSNKVAHTMPGDLNDYQQVTCTFEQTGAGWSGTGCTKPKLVSIP